MTRNEFIDKMKSIHEDRVGFDKVPDDGSEIYKTSRVDLYCKVCDMYYNQEVFYSLKGNKHKGCKASSLRLTKESFIAKAKERYGDAYDYDKVIYTEKYIPVTILCKKCNVWFDQKPELHLSGNGHPNCPNRVKINKPKPNGPKKFVRTLEDFIAKARSIHGDRYDYSKVDYVDSRVNVKIICSIHGEFEQSPHSHLKGHNCYLCGRASHKDKVTKTQDEFIKLAKEIHGDKYDYSKTKYTTTYNKVIIGCPVHGDFEVRADGHLKYGCARCGADAIMHTTESFIKRAKELHGDRYDYSKSVYEHSTKPITIICKEHGEFTQVASEHIRSRAPGCGVCATSLGEKLIFDILKQNNINFIKEYKLGRTNYRYDYYLTDLNILLEYDGLQHYKPIPFFGGMKYYEYIRNNDSIKTTLAETHNIPLVRITYMDAGNIAGAITNKLIKYVKYKRDGKYFKNFLEYAKHFGLDGDAKSIDHKQYLFKLV